MKQLLIGDCHFGIKTNSVTWLNAQLTYFRTQIYDTIKNEDVDRIVFLGDLTDIRYSIEQQIGIELKNMIREMLDIYKDKEFIMLAGNHDYFSPLEEFAQYNSYELLFGPEFLQCHPNLKFVNQEPYLADDGSLFLPWYWTDNTDHFDELLYQFDMKHEVNAIFCHADLSVWPGARITSLYGKPVYSGHIHYIYEDTDANLFNLGAVFPLTFNDVNQDRFVYILNDDFKVEKKIKNITTFKFIRLYNEQLFDADDDVFHNSYIQLCVTQENINKARYIDQIKYLRLTYPDANIGIHVMDDDADIEELTQITNTGFNTNINKYIEENVPEHLNNKYEIIKQKIKENNI